MAAMKTPYNNKCIGLEIEKFVALVEVIVLCCPVRHLNLFVPLSCIDGYRPSAER